MKQEHPILEIALNSDFMSNWAMDANVGHDELVELISYVIAETEDWCDAYYDQAVSNAVQDTKAAMRAKTYHYIDCGIQLGSERQKSISDFCAWEVEDMRTTLEREAVK